MSIIVSRSRSMRSFTVIFLISLFLIPYGNLYSAKVYEGAKIRVNAMQKQYLGNLLSVTDDLMVIREKDSNRILGLKIEDIDVLKVGKKSKVVKGALIGTGIGIIIVGGLLLIVPKKGDSFGDALGSAIIYAAAITVGIIMLGVLGLGGGILGAILGKGKTFKLSKMNPEKKAKAIRKLTGYALFGPVIPEEIKPQLIVVGDN